MTVTLLAHTLLTPEAEEVLTPDAWEKYDGVEWSEDADHLAELAGRECYQSFHRPNPGTAANEDYIANIVRQNHTSVLAHASFTFRFTDVSRALTHELIRHRFLAFSEVSQRYVNMEESYTVIPPLFRDNPVAKMIFDSVDKVTRAAYAALVKLAESSGATRKEARQAARYVLPGGNETKIVVSGNVRAWRDFVIQRNSPGADAEIREVAGRVLEILNEHAPASVADLMETSDDV